MKLFLCKLKHLSNFTYALDKEPNEVSGNESRYSATQDVYTIEELRIINSIFSPPVIKVVIRKPLEEIVPYLSVFGIGFYDDASFSARYAKRNDSSAESFKPNCLIMNKNNDYVPFVAIHSVILPDDKELLTLMEKRALSLATEHSFSVIASSKTSSKKDENENEAKGLLSIAEVAEAFSTITESEHKIDDGKTRNILSFTSASITRQTKDEKKSRTCYDEKTHCAFISRYVAAEHQSRLSNLLSLLYKYGYGIVYRPADRQYQAIDLLSSTAPGHENQRSTSGKFKSVYTFDGEENTRYFEQYAKECKKVDKETRKEAAKNKKPAPSEQLLESNFADFFINRVVKTAHKIFNIENTTSQQAVNGYFYLSRYSPLASSTNYIAKSSKNSDRFGFDLTALSRFSEEDSTNVSNLISKDKVNISSAFAQNTRYSYVNGGDQFTIEDQIELNHKGLKEKRYVKPEKDSVITVNQRLNYSKYKLNHMQHNYSIWRFDYKNNSAISRTYNLVYELFSRLGYHTDVFARASKYTSAEIVERKTLTPSGSSRSVAEKKANKKDVDEDFAQFINTYYTNNPYDVSGAIFGKFVIEIKNAGPTKKDGNDIGDDYDYDMNAFMYFYNDLVEYNFASLAKPEKEDNLIKLVKVPGDKTNGGDKPKDNDPDPKKGKVTGDNVDKKPKRPVKYIKQKHFTTIIFNGKPYNIDPKTVLSRIPKDVYLNGYLLGGSHSNQKVSHDAGKASELPHLWNDPLKVIENYLAKKRLKRYNKDRESLQAWLDELNDQKRKMDLNYQDQCNYEREVRKNGKAFVEISDGAAAYQEAEKKAKYAKYALEVLFKTPAGAHGSIVKDRFGNWRKVNMKERKKYEESGQLKELWGAGFYENADVLPNSAIEKELKYLEEQTRIAWIGKEGLLSAEERFWKK